VLSYLHSYTVIYIVIIACMCYMLECLLSYTHVLLQGCVGFRPDRLDIRQVSHCDLSMVVDGI